MGFLTPRGERVITSADELRQAAIDAFLDGNPETCQHIVDTLGDRTAGRGATKEIE